jgi:hypothetical protein
MDCAIDDYLAQLTHSELYRVKSKILAHIRLASRGPEALPVEIIVMISEYLSVRDLSRQRRVSKAWSVIWDQPAISSALCRRVWPGYMECHAGQGPSQDPGALLLKGVKETMGALPKAEQVQRVLGGQASPTKRMWHHTTVAGANRSSTRASWPGP